MNHCCFGEAFHAKVASKFLQKIWSIFVTDFSFNHSPVTELKNESQLHPHFLLTIEKQNAMSAILWLITINDDRLSIFIIDENIYIVKLDFHQSLYSGTLFVGSLGKKNGKWLFLIKDMKFLKQMSTNNMSLMGRLQNIHCIVKAKFKYVQNVSPCNIALASYFLYNHFALISQKCKLLFVSDTECLSYQYCPIVTKHYQNGEIKEFIAEKTPTIDVYKLYYHRLFVDILVVNSIRVANTLRRTFNEKNEMKLCCCFDSFFNSWIFLRALS